MITATLTTSDGIGLRYAHTAEDGRKEWIVLIIPFGLDVRMAAPFFEFFGKHYNICAWESRSVLEDSDRECEVTEFSIDRHVGDLLAIMNTLGVQEGILVGYCSGAGIALAALNLAPNRFTDVVLAHGEYTLLSDAKCTTRFAADMDGLLCLAASSDQRARLVFERIRTERFAADAHRPAGLDQPFSDLRFLKRYARNYLSYKSVDFAQLAAEVCHPTLLLAGAKDMQVNVHSAQKIHACMRNSSLFIDPEADHYGVLSRDSDTLVAIWNHICENGYARQQRRTYSRCI
jgi:pimeloyl-ACP methyl ester carboxylesterase